MASQTKITPLQKYLFDLQASGKTNMVAALPFLQAKYPKRSSEVLTKELLYWMANYEALDALRCVFIRALC